MMTFGVICMAPACAAQGPSPDFSDLFTSAHTQPLPLRMLLSLTSQNPRFDPPAAITTAAFPDRLQRKRVRKRKTCHKGDCTICLESLVCGTAIALPCGHVLHRRCLCALSGNETTGASSMIRCPSCREALGLSG